MSKIQGQMDRIPAEIAMEPEYHALKTVAANRDAAQSAVDKVIQKANTVSNSKPRCLNPARFLCRSEVRNFLLEYAARNRSHKFSRVSEGTLVSINEAVRQVMVDHVRRLPSKGKTI